MRIQRINRWAKGVEKVGDTGKDGEESGMNPEAKGDDRAKNGRDLWIVKCGLIT
jgi:hypothetical protein